MMLLRSILRPCLALKNTTAFTQRLSLHHTTHVRIMKVMEEAQTVPVENRSDRLMADLDTVFPSKILFSLENNEDIVDGSHIVMALKKFMKLYLNKKASAKITDLTDQEFFKQLSSVIRSKASNLTVSEILQILEILKRMDIPNNLEIVELLAKHIEKKLHYLSLTEISALASLLKNVLKPIKANSLMDNLKHKFIIKMSMEFDENDISHLAHGLSFTAFNMKNHDLEHIVVEKLQKYKGEIPLKYAILILEALCEHYYAPRTLQQAWFDVYHRVLDILTENSEFLSADEVIYAIYIVSERIRRDQRYVKNLRYNEKFYDNLLKKVVEDDMGFEKALSVLKSLNSIRHQSKELLNYCSASYYEKIVISEHNISDEAGKLLVLIHGLALSKCKTIFWDQIENFVCQNRQTLLSYDHQTLCILALNLCILGSHPYFLLEKVFDGKFDYSQDKFMHWTFCKLVQLVQLDKEYVGPMPTKSQMESLKAFVHKKSARNENYKFLLLDPLKEWLGDEKYIKMNVATKLNHLIDYFLVFDENGKPVSINTSKKEPNDLEYIEDLNIPPEYKTICLLHLPYYWYWRNTKKLMGIYTVPVDTLEAMNYKVVAVNKLDWNGLQENQKKDFIVNKILSKLDDS